LIAEDDANPLSASQPSVFPKGSMVAALPCGPPPDRVAEVSRSKQAHDAPCMLGSVDPRAYLLEPHLVMGSSAAFRINKLVQRRLCLVGSGGLRFQYGYPTRRSIRPKLAMLSHGACSGPMSVSGKSSKNLRTR
jgi:hypothetical protein